MPTTTRNIEFRIYPRVNQQNLLINWLGLHCELYNAALQERRDAYQKCKVSLSYNHQQNELPEVKKHRPDLVPLGSHSLQETVRRVDRAFKGFFRRVKEGQKPGYPRFKSRMRFDSFTYPDPAGWKIIEHKDHKGKLKISNLGFIPMRGKPRVAIDSGTPRTLTIKRKNDKWYAVIGVRYDLTALSRNCGYEKRSVGIDAGCKDLVFTSDNDRILNPKYLSESQKKLKKAQKELSRKKRGSRNRFKARKKVITLHQNVAQKRKDFLHQLSACIVFLYSFIAIEKLILKNMTRSAKGTIEKPGKNVKQKAGLNRSMLDASIGLLFFMLSYKAEEAGGHIEKVNPNGTTQKCFRCGITVPKKLSDRVHNCPHCGFVANRDYNAALNILSLGLIKAGREPSEAWRERAFFPVKHETASM